MILWSILSSRNIYFKLSQIFIRIKEAFDWPNFQPHGRQSQASSRVPFVSFSLCELAYIKATLLWNKVRQFYSEILLLRVYSPSKIQRLNHLGTYQELSHSCATSRTGLSEDPTSLRATPPSNPTRLISFLLPSSHLRQSSFFPFPIFAPPFFLLLLNSSVSVTYQSINSVFPLLTRSTSFDFS